jgi:hypothetical protein
VRTANYIHSVFEGAGLSVQKQVYGEGKPIEKRRYYFFTSAKWNF